MRTYLAIGRDDFAALKQEIWAERERWALFAAGTYNGPAAPPVGAKLEINETSLARIFDMDLWGSDPQHVLIRDFWAEEIDFHKEIRANATHIMLCRHHDDDRIVVFNGNSHFQNRYVMQNMGRAKQARTAVSKSFKLAGYSVYAMPVGLMVAGVAWLFV